MKIISIFLVMFVISCSKKTEDKVDLKSFIEQGKKIQLFKTNQAYKKNIKQIDKVITSNNKKINYWNQSNYSLSNYIPSTQVEIYQKKHLIINGEFDELISLSNKIITINKYSKLQIFDKNLKKILSKKIYNKKIYKNFNLDFKLIGKGNKIYVADNLGNIHCYNVENLDLVWKQKLSVPFMSNIKIYKNDLFIINSNSKIFSLNISSGKINWSFETVSKDIKSKGSYQISIYDNKLYFTNDVGEIYCVDLLKNNIIWSLTFEPINYSQKPITFKSSPIIINRDNLFVSTNFGFLYAINPKSGLVKWSLPIENTNNFLVDKNLIFLANQDRFVIINLLNGNIIYNQQIPSIKSKSKLQFENLLLGKKNIILFSKDGQIILVNKRNLGKVKVFKKYIDFKNFIVISNNLYLITSKSLVRFR
ncbi:PQQ-binding-like beta-propeller repeat protein [Candidatus Pelagibacter sp. HIMB109]|uniref:PQQ-binding-like beta-propeller repeat protein n=1 Tax=Candidatus Pelagibacter sp. HIMB109 TaxID=3415412 RepID=UPI003F855301